MSVFYERFERHAHGEGLKARSTHYCPGCGHGLVHGYLADAIEELGVQDRTVAISPVGCSVFLYYYMDVGNTQAAHGRAPAVALGHKLANPDSVVVSYQGDGDLASIGLAEIIHAAQTGIPISVIFVNNAIYGMTGGQMAPTTLMGQKTATSPAGRERLMGEPLRMAELIAQIDGPVYVERVALYDNKQRLRARKAVKKALECQVQGKGFAFVEVLAECPLHLGKTPLEAEAWVKECMLPVFPLGIKKDVAREPWPAWPSPSFDPQRLCETIGAAPEAGSPPARPVAAPSAGAALKLAGAGGDGAQTAALLIATAAVAQGLDATHIPSYGPESRGGTSYADVRIEPDEVLSPAVPRPDVLLAFNAPSVARFLPSVRDGGTLVYDSSVVTTPPVPERGIRCVAVPATLIAERLGRRVVKNIVALGALQRATGLLSEESLLDALRRTLHSKPALVALNEAAFRAGAEAAAQALAEEEPCSAPT